jgi:hypothetical protein
VCARGKRYITSHVRTVKIARTCVGVTFARNQTSILINSPILININAAGGFTIPLLVAGTPITRRHKESADRCRVAHRRTSRIAYRGQSDRDNYNAADAYRSSILSPKGSHFAFNFVPSPRAVRQVCFSCLKCCCRKYR